MITLTVSFAMRLLYSSYEGIRAVTQVLGYVLPRNMSSVKAKINFNSKHLAKGDPLPPYNGKPRLFNMRFCPYAQRAVLALNAKNIDYEIINVDLKDKPEWLKSKSAFLKVPALEVADGVSIYESLVIVQYLDDAYPENPLLPKDAVAKAYDKILIEASSAVQSLLFKLAKAPEEISDDVWETYYKFLDLLQNELQKRGTTFLDGGKPGYGDYMLWPWFERLKSLDNGSLKLDEQKYKILVEYINNMLKDPVVAEYRVPNEIFQEFHSAFATGEKPNYDILLDK